MNFFNDVGYILANYWSDFLLGVLWTLVISLVATLIGLLIGLIIGIIRTIPLSKNKIIFGLQKVINFILSAYIEVFRGTPMMVQALIFKYGFQAMGVNFENIFFIMCFCLFGKLFYNLMLMLQKYEEKTNIPNN